MIRCGQIYMNANSKVMLSQLGKGGIEILMNRNQLQVETIKGYLKESQMIENLDNSVVQLVKLIYTKLLDTKEEESDFEGLGIRVVRSTKPCPT